MHPINAAIIAESMAYPVALKLIPEKDWPPLTKKAQKVFESKVSQVWRNRKFMVLVYPEKDGIERLTCFRTLMKDDGSRFVDGITWDELQALKNECGRGDRWALEVYPADSKIVNVSNMRHLWVLPAGKTPDMGWL